MSEHAERLPGGQSPAEREPWPSPVVAWYGVGLFALTLLVVFTNSNIFNLLIQPIKVDLELTDVQASYVIGVAAAANSVFILPISRLVDMMSRRLIISIGLVMASIANVWAGLSGTFWQLLFARTAGGIGGAGNGPATFSILADYFPPAKLPKALAVMNIGFLYAIAASLLFGGTLIAMVSGMADISLPVVGSLRPWQLVFLIMAIPELLLAVLMVLTLPEPKRRGVQAALPGAAAARRPVVPVKDVFKFLYKNRSAFGPMFAGLSVNSLAMGTAAWSAPFFERTYGWGPAQYGIIQGFVLLLIAPIGLIAGGMLAERFARQGHDDANLRVVFIASALHLPFAMLFALMPTPHLAIALAALNTATISMGSGPQNAALQVIIPNEMRGQITALFLLCFSLIGMSISPIMIAFLTQYVFGAESMLRYSIATTHIVLGPIATIIFWYGLKPYGKAFAAARAWH
jgi:MFS family permease